MSSKAMSGTKASTKRSAERPLWAFSCLVARDTRGPRPSSPPSPRCRRRPGRVHDSHSPWLSSQVLRARRRNVDLPSVRVGAGREPTVNVLPRPSPGLSAVAVPPWRRTMLRTIAKPRPRPPCERIDLLVLLNEHLEDFRKKLGGDAASVVGDLDHDICPPACPFNPNPSGGIGVLRGVDNQVGDNLREPSGIAVHAETRPRDVDEKLVPLLLEQRACSFDGSGDDFGGPRSAPSSARFCRP